MTIRASRILAALGASMALSCALGAPADAAESDQPLTITHFSTEAMSATVESMVEGSFGREPEFTNVPYASPFTQAGAHPWGLTTTLEFATKPDLFGDPGIWPTREPKDIVVSLPPGLVGNPTAVPRCPLTDALALGECPLDSQVGFYRVQWLGGKELIAPIVDVVPQRGQSAEFAFLNEAKISAVLTGHLVRIPASAGKPATYGLTVASNGIPSVQLYRVETTFWGVPADPSHDPMRGLICGKVSHAAPRTCNFGTGNATSGVPAVPFLTMGANCAEGPQSMTVRADSWEEPGRITPGGHYEGFVEATDRMPALTGCDLLSFSPSIEAQPNPARADEPLSLNLNVQVPQNEVPGGLATPDLRDAVITLPQGVSINPAAADGIRGCPASGPEGINIEGPLSEEIGPSGELQLAPGRCPPESIVGSAEAITPLLPTPVRGHVYLAEPRCGGAGQAPCTEHDVIDGGLYRLYLELGGTGELAETGVHIKVEGRTEVNPSTGQITTRFLQNPQAPFKELKVDLSQGARAPLASPPQCGRATTTSDLTPWSAPGKTPEGSLVAGIGDAAPSSFFDVEGCPDPQPFNPRMTAGTTVPVAGDYSPFVFELSRQDRERYVSGMRMHMPAGLSAMLSSVPLCPEPQASQGACDQGSQIGTAKVAAGPGSHPFETEGAIYLTGPYRAAPFGLSVVTHVQAGPFNLGVVVVRGRIEIDPHDATPTIALDEDGAYAIPQILFGVPLRLQRLSARIDRPGFMFNPTNCDAQQVTASISAVGGAVASVASPFAVGDCKKLTFSPRFSASTSGHASRSKGASLDTRLSYPAGSFGRQANIARVKVDLPKQLPSRLATLQKACPASTFDINPAACPAASVVGVVKARTPVLPDPLSGPVYFVSHGGEGFPALIVVLQGDGVRIDLTGSTFIHKGITSSTFKNVPDAPVTTFELFLPQGRFSALAANGSLCKVRGGLKMPIEFVAQNGLVIHRVTKIGVTGCPRGKRPKRKPTARSRSARALVSGRTSR
jgi:hypothetical protein